MIGRFVVALFLASLFGCNTIEGIGKDIERGGKAIKQEAKDIKKSM
ncbi:MAG TPA: entericidin A/B family lipoprotein [Rhodocyclaceae bacterium]|nr:entericidin A/B family lipoprotein [Rhodocyclaceae bacterium]